MSGIREQLQQARADLHALEGDTATLQGNLTTAETKLNELRRAARSGSAQFEDVVAQQNRVTAARGLLDMHLTDIANTSALKDELEAALSAADVIEEGRTAQAESVRLHTEHAQLAAQLESQLRDGLKRLDELDRAYRTARGRVFASAIQHLERVLNVDSSRLVNALDGATASETRIDRDTLNAALTDFSSQIDAQPQQVKQVHMGDGAVLMSDAYPLLNKARSGARRV